MTNGDGSLTFTHLGPGQYYLRPMKKEYQFDPPSQVSWRQTYFFIFFRIRFPFLDATTSLQEVLSVGPSVYP